MIDPKALARAALLYGIRVYVPNDGYIRRDVKQGRVAFILVHGGPMPSYAAYESEHGITGKYLYEHSTMDDALLILKALEERRLGWCLFDDFDLRSDEVSV